jgi:hypothetical protein
VTDGRGPGQDDDADPSRPASSRLPQDVARQLRAEVRSTVDEWLSERSNTVSLAVAQVVEDALARLQASHAARVADLQAAHEKRVGELELLHAETLRAARRRRRASARAVEQELRAKIELLERSLAMASLEGIDRLRDVTRREAERIAEIEASWQSRLRAKDEEIERLRHAGSNDAYYDALRDQLLQRKPM